MKKLFFTAFIAGVAVGAAYADTIDLYTAWPNQQKIYTCKDEAEMSCSWLTTTYYESDGWTAISYWSYTSLFFM